MKKKNELNDISSKAFIIKLFAITICSLAFYTSEQIAIAKSFVLTAFEEMSFGSFFFFIVIFSICLQ